MPVQTVSRQLESADRQHPTPPVNPTDISRFRRTTAVRDSGEKPGATAPDYQIIQLNRLRHSRSHPRCPFGTLDHILDVHVHLSEQGVQVDAAVVVGLDGGMAYTSRHAPIDKVA